MISCRQSSNQDSRSFSSKQQVPLSRQRAACPVGSATGLWALLTFRLLSLLRIIAVSMWPQSPRWYGKHDGKFILIFWGCHLALMDAATTLAVPLNLHREHWEGSWRVWVGVGGGHSGGLELFRWSRGLVTKLSMNHCTTPMSSAGQSNRTLG